MAKVPLAADRNVSIKEAPSALAAKRVSEAYVDDPTSFTVGGWMVAHSIRRLIITSHRDFKKDVDMTNKVVATSSLERISSASPYWLRHTVDVMHVGALESRAENACCDPVVCHLEVFAVVHLKST